MLIDQQANWNYPTVGIPDSDYLEELKLLQHKGGREEDVRNLGDSPWYHLALQCLVVRVEG